MQTDNHAKRILLGISGGIAAYKAPLLVRNLRTRGADVVPVLTQNATRFVTETALQAVAGHRPRTDLWDAEAEASMGHIELARWADAVVIAPATANVIARLANGITDDLLTTLYLATAAPVFVAPAMNVKMWEHPATRRNFQHLRDDGVTVLGPADGEQACGEFGPGRMVEPEEIAETVMAAVAAPRILDGTRVLITAGPTREFLDPVRFISNRSSGRQGFALAEAARDAGAEVTLVAGPVHLFTPTGIERIDVVSAQEMKDEVTKRAPQADIFVSVAAVADYRPHTVHDQKLKKSQQQPGDFRVALKENEDIVGSIAGVEPRPFVVGFAAETEHPLEYARDKRRKKCMDAIVVNDVSDPAIGFDSGDNAVTLIHAGGELGLPKMPKGAIARRLVAEIATLYGTAGRG
ncbi:MAG: bifunctional phosphopantothenoylcysteine decarboxylase/phosphopantothenate--cysteine ligase CoaBC [Gammaproteobacteria bacterium]|nr:bifunctional phosphopantothenoylcysteine decarboxylase/phosphopantothenate--cysteine ligase CoaBC [Gammaproteobacteria bacterium]